MLVDWSCASMKIASQRAVAWYPHVEEAHWFWWNNNVRSPGNVVLDGTWRPTLRSSLQCWCVSVPKSRSLAALSNLTCCWEVYRPSFAVPSRSPHQNRRTIGVEVSENILHAVSKHQLARRRSQLKSGAVNLLKSPHHCYREDLKKTWGFVVRWRWGCRGGMPTVSHVRCGRKGRAFASYPRSTVVAKRKVVSRPSWPQEPTYRCSLFFGATSTLRYWNKTCSGHGFEWSFRSQRAKTFVRPAGHRCCRREGLLVSTVISHRL